MGADNLISRPRGEPPTGRNPRLAVIFLTASLGEMMSLDNGADQPRQAVRTPR